MRTAGICLDGERVLLYRAEFEDVWSLPGGRIEMLELAKDALRREMFEELGEEVKVGRLVWTVENFSEHQGVSYHELGLYFLVSVPESSRLPLSGRQVRRVRGQWCEDYRSLVRPGEPARAPAPP